MKTQQPVWPIGLGLLALYFLAAVIEPADGAEIITITQETQQCHFYGCGYWCG